MLARAFVLTSVLALGACGGSDSKPFWQKHDGPVQREAIAVQRLDVSVPDTLRVSESFMLYPMTDIVWRGDTPGDRHQQVRNLFIEAADKTEFNKGRPGNVSIEVSRFHGLTQMARYYTGGVYGIHFRLTVTDPRTGEVIERRKVKADLPQWGAHLAPEYDAQGISEHAMIVNYLADTLTYQLGQN
jgi:hypothetical protein